MRNDLHGLEPAAARHEDQFAAHGFRVLAPAAEGVVLESLEFVGIDYCPLLLDRGNVFDRLDVLGVADDATGTAIRVDFEVFGFGSAIPDGDLGERDWI